VWGIFPTVGVRKVPHTHEEDAERDEQHAAPTGTPSLSATALNTSTTTGADPRATGYTTDTSPLSYARASNTK
jgi:hypothetical protein